MVEPGDAVLEVEDEDFLSAVSEAEANALSNKRRKTFTFDAAEEGVYTAALKGSNSLAWKQSATAPLGGPGSRSLSSISSSGQSDGGDSSPPVKPCPCGLGTCHILTSNTQKNPGRKFYKCPIREENGGCGFFQWCDNSSGISNNAFGTSNYGSNSSFPDLKCPCGAGSCLILTAKTGNNAGQQFYRCPASQGGSCGFFKWCNDQTVSAGIHLSASGGYNTATNASIKSYGAQSGSSCFKCGKEGHWAKDCQMSSSDPIADSGGRLASLGIYYNTTTNASIKSYVPGYNTTTNASIKSYGAQSGSSCFKRGKEGHWAKDCQMSLSDPIADSGGRPASSGTCYKCGMAGHWARDCSSSQETKVRHRQ